MFDINDIFWKLIHGNDPYLVVQKALFEKKLWAVSKLALITVLFKKKNLQLEKRNGWVNVGDLQGAVHFKIVRYERIKFLVVGLESTVEIYAWAPKPYHKFMAFKVYFDVFSLMFLHIFWRILFRMNLI